MIKHIELIIDYIVTEDGDFHYNDNTGRIVRCKDCKHYRMWQMKCDKLHVKPIADNHYCSYGEREEP